MLELATMQPVQRQTPCLVVTSGDSALGQIFRLSGEMVIGRTVGCDVVLAEADVSRRHAKVTVRDDGRVELHDLESSNGLAHRGRAVRSAVLDEGDAIGIGRARLVMVRMDDVDALLARNSTHVARDGAAGLLSRRYFLDVLTWDLEQVRRDGRVLAVACLAVDDFAAKRDEIGAGAADRLVKRLAASIVETLQDADLPIGLTAEGELSVVMDADSIDAAMNAVSVIARRASTPPRITTSAGVAVAVAVAGPTPRQRASSLFAAAQRALLHARAAGGAQVHAAT